MKKILKNSFMMLIILVVLLFAFQTCSEATVYSEQMQQIIKDSETAKDSTNSVNQINGIVSTIITSIRIAGIGVAVTMLLTLAMKYMSAAPGDKADVKKSLITFTIGACVFFGVVEILEIISQFASAI